jgi:hypothetical protein
MSTREIMPITSGDHAPREHALRMDWRRLHDTEHIVQFYETDSFLLQALSDFVVTGLAAGDACIVVATPCLSEALGHAGGEHDR